MSIIWRLMRVPAVSIVSVAAGSSGSEVNKVSEAAPTKAVIMSDLGPPTLRTPLQNHSIHRAYWATGLSSKGCFQVQIVDRSCFFALLRRMISTSKIWKLGSFRWSYCFQRSWQTIWWLSISFLSGFFSFRIIHLDFLIVVLSGFPDSLIRSTLWCWLLNSWKFPSFLSIPWNNPSLYVFRLFSEGKYGNIKAHWLRSTILARYKQNYNQYQKTA